MRIVFAGTPEFAVPPLQALLKAQHNVLAVYTQPDRPAGRGQTLQQSPVKKLALHYQIPVFQPLHLRDPKEQQTLKQLCPDLLIVAAYGLILPAVILNIPKQGCLNIHASLLPRWRGAAPIQHAILADDKTTGISIMQMDEGLDTGDILFTSPYPIESTETTSSLYLRLATLGATTLIEALAKLEKGGLSAIKQAPEQVTYAPKISKQAAKINWLESAELIDRKIRAFNPAPVAFTTLQSLSSASGKILPGQTMVRIWSAKVLSSRSSNTHSSNKKFLHKKEDPLTSLTPNTHLKPGTILKADKEGVDVATGNGILRLLTLQLPGGKRLSVAEILNSKREWLQVGSFFD